MNNSPINSTINSTTIVELADATSLPKDVNSFKLPFEYILFLIIELSYVNIYFL